MPTYSYRCTECDTAFDIQQSFTDSSLTVCPTCQGKLRKVFSAIGVSFTGSGFYRNDARAEAKASNTGSRKTAEKSGEKTAASAEKPAKAAEKVSATPAAKESKPSAGASSAKSTAGSAAPTKS